MAKPRHRQLDYLVYLAVRLVITVLQVFPLETGRRLARLLAWIAYRVDHRHRLVADDNLRHAYGHALDAAARDRLIRDVYLHFMCMLIEMLHLPRLIRPGTWRRHLILGPRSAEVVAALLTGRSVLIVTGHYGNWELAGYLLAMLGFKSYAVARPLDNPYLDNLLRRLRQRTGQKLLAKKGELNRMEEILQSGGIVCTLGDQDAGQNGLYVDFFGRPASTHKAMALLALRCQTLIVVAGARRLPGLFRYELAVEEVIDAAELGYAPGVVKSLTQRLTSALERMVRGDPRQYLWLHRRWKHQPEDRPKLAAQRAA
jgi:KDO2-lipid IV(A) lauroyltransferase